MGKSYSGDFTFNAAFDVDAAKPLDTRLVVDALTDLTNSISYPYVGLLVYVKGEGKYYAYKETSSNVFEWVELASGGSNVNTNDCVKFDTNGVIDISNKSFGDNILPSSNNSFDLGSSSYRFNQGFINKLNLYNYYNNKGYKVDVYVRDGFSDLIFYESGKGGEVRLPIETAEYGDARIVLSRDTTNGCIIYGGMDSGSKRSITITNNFTLGSACEKGFIDASSARAISTSGDLTSERTVYHGLPYINGNHTYNSGTYIYAPTSAGTSGYILKSNGSGAPSWIQSVPFANGGTGSTSRLGAAKALTNESVASPEYVVSLTSNWGKFGYSTLAQLLSAFSPTIGILKISSTSTHNWSASYTNIIGSLSLASTTCGLGSAPTTTKGWFFKFNKSKIFRGCLLNKGLTSAYIFRNGTGTSDAGGMTYASEMGDSSSYYICGNYPSSAYYLLIGL